MNDVGAATQPLEMPVANPAPELSFGKAKCIEFAELQVETAFLDASGEKDREIRRQESSIRGVVNLGERLMGHLVDEPARTALFTVLSE